MQDSNVEGLFTPVFKWVDHRQRTPYEGINQRYLKNLADVANKICFGRTYNFGIGIEF